jgi:hypothetical protein
MKICLFDWNAGGHHNFHARAFAEALAPSEEVVIAGSDPLLDSIEDVTVAKRSLGPPRPRPGADKDLDKAALAKREIDLLREAVAAHEPDHAIVLFADPMLRWLSTTDRFPCTVSIFIMFASAHFPRAYGLRLTPKARLSAEFKEWNIRRWRWRSDAGVLFGLDTEAVAGWKRKSGAPAHWLPEPPLEVKPVQVPTVDKGGCFLFGYFDERKGTDRLAAALGEDCEGLRLALFGDVAPEYRVRLDGELARLRQGGVKLETDLRRVPYGQAMEKMARSRCALLSFGWQPAGSRVLLEAAAARTPVVVSSDSPIGKQVERYGLGRTADPNDPAALREAILSIAADPAAPDRYADGLRRFAEEVHGDRFSGELRRALGLGPSR